MENFVRMTTKNLTNKKIQNNFSEFESIYVHIPFCEIKCPYCDFNAYSKIDNLTESLIAAIKSEIHFWSVKFPSMKIKSIYFGGGTPSWIDSIYIYDIVTDLKKHFEFNENIEITIECNPIDLLDTKISDYKSAGINRYSVGIQSLNNKILKFIGRNHNREQALKGINNLLKNNISNFSVDIMYGIPKQSYLDIKDTVNDLLKFNPTHFSAYSFTIEPNTPFEKYVRERKIIELNEDEYMKIFHQLYDILEENDYFNYEISNWAKPNYESIHNLNYWDNNKFLGIGPGAHSYINNYRFHNEKSPKKYIAKIDDIKSNPSSISFFDILKNNDFILDSEKIDIDTQIREYMIFSLRKNEGLNYSEFQKEFKKPMDIYLTPKFEDFINLGILEINDKTFRFTNKGKLLSNEVFREILYPEKM